MFSGLGSRFRPLESMAVSRGYLLGKTMGQNELKFSVKRRLGKIEFLMNTEEGKPIFNKLLLALSMGASITSSAGMLGISPQTLTRWIRRGKVEEEGLYADFYEGVFQAISKATAEAEIEVAQTKPQFYLTNGAARVIVGDYYNVKSEEGSNNYNLDGTISPGVVDDLAIRSNENQKIESDDTSDAESISQQNMIEALKHLRSMGVDLNQLVDERGKIGEQ
jgi:transposase-like protein